MIDPYSILELENGASEHQVKQAYRNLAKRYHPDVSKDPSASEKFIAISDAYEQIMNGSTHYRDLYENFNSEPQQTYQPNAHERAQQYARDRYEEFLKNNTEFKQKWYYFPTKFFSYMLVYLMYFFGIVLMAIPLGVGIMTSFEDGFVLPLVLTGFGVLWLKTSKKFEKEIEVYFKEY